MSMISLLHRVFGGIRPTAKRASYSLPVGIREWLTIIEVEDAEAHAGELFRYCFGSPPPDFPRHFIARYHSGQREGTLGYVHFTTFDNTYLGGGMCMDDRLYRRLPKEQRAALKAAGGIAEQLLRHCLAELAPAQAIFGFVGDSRAERVDLRVGFQHTGIPHLIVHWPRPLPAADMQELIRKAAAVGPF
jgi:hypothetical protein